MDNLFDIVELAADFLGDALQGVRVADEVEQSGSHGSGRGIGTSNDEQVGLAPELGGAEALAGLGIASLEQVVEEVATISLLAQLGALGELGFAVGHVSRAAGSQLGEQELVNLELVDDGHSAADEMSGRGRLDELQGKSIVGLLEHVERLSEAEIPENIHGKIVAPVAHIARTGPSLGINVAIVEANLLAEGADVAQDVALHLLHGALGKGVRQDTALASVDILVASVVRVGGGMDKGIVELGLADVGAETINILERLVGIEGERVGAKANNLAYRRWESATIHLIASAASRGNVRSYHISDACARIPDGDRPCMRGRAGSHL